MEWGLGTRFLEHAHGFARFREDYVADLLAGLSFWWPDRLQTAFYVVLGNKAAPNIVLIVHWPLPFLSSPLNRTLVFQLQFLLSYLVRLLFYLLGPRLLII